MYLRIWFLIIFLGKSMGGLPALSILGFSYLAAMIPIPTAFTMIIRGANLIIALVELLILYRLGIGLVRNNLFKNQ